MEIADIHRLTVKLDEAKWSGIFKGQQEDDQEEDEFVSVLCDMHTRAGEDVNALLTFFEFITNNQGSSGAYYEWDSQEFLESFAESFRGADGVANAVLMRHYEGSRDERLSSMLGDQHIPHFFDWTGYVKQHRPDLHLMQRSGMYYLFSSH